MTGSDRMHLMRAAAVLSLTLALAGCGALDHGFLNAAGPVASEQREIYVIVSLVMIFVAGPVLLLVPLVAWHYRLSNTHHAYRPRWTFSWTLEGLIWLPPAAIVAGLSVLVWHYTHRLDPYKSLTGGDTIEIETVALDWKWLFIHRLGDFAEVNRLVIPVGQPVHLRLTSGTVMQSIMIPRLAGQIYAMGGMTTTLNLRADKAGEYRGENTQFNGQGFAKQSFVVVAMEPPDYAAWRKTASTMQAYADDDLQALFRPGVIVKPTAYWGVPANLFEQVIARVSNNPAMQPMGAH